MITQIDGQSIGADIENNPTLNFAKDFFPVLNKVLFKENDDQM
jgi:hypothetical protein